MFDYSEKLMDHFKNPRHHGRMENPDGVGKEGNPRCGDVMELYIKVKDNKITDIKFLTFGCVAAIGISSILTEVALGKTLQEAENITTEDLIKVVGEIPPIKYHCSVLGIQALQQAINNYREKQKKQ